MIPLSLPGCPTSPGSSSSRTWSSRPLAGTGSRHPARTSGLRDALLGENGTIRATILSRSTQTNEAGRLATLTPAFATIAVDQPLALVEVGASAGLCLYPDRYSYAWATESGPVTAGEGPRLECEVTGGCRTS